MPIEIFLEKCRQAGTHAVGGRLRQLKLPDRRDLLVHDPPLHPDPWRGNPSKRYGRRGNLRVTLPLGHRGQARRRP